MTRKRKASPPIKRRTRSEKQIAAAMLARLRDGQDLRSRKARRLRAAIRVHRFTRIIWKLHIAALERMMRRDPLRECFARLR